MSKKVILGIVAAVLLLGAENLLAKEKTDKPKARQKQAQKLQQKKKGLHQKQAQPIQKRFDSWFGQLTKAYRQNDREKMGQLLRNMHQFRERQTKAKDAVGERRQDFCGGARARKREAGQFRGGLGGREQGIQRRGMGRPDPDMPPRGMGGRQQRTHDGRRGYRNPGFPQGGMRNWRQDSHNSEWDW